MLIWTGVRNRGVGSSGPTSSLGELLQSLASHVRALPLYAAGRASMGSGTQRTKVGICQGDSGLLWWMDLEGRRWRQGDRYGDCWNSPRKRWQEPGLERQMAHMTATASPGRTRECMAQESARRGSSGGAWDSAGVSSVLPGGGGHSHVLERLSWEGGQICLA